MHNSNRNELESIECNPCKYPGLWETHSSRQHHVGWLTNSNKIENWLRKKFTKKSNGNAWLQIAWKNLELQNDVIIDWTQTFEIDKFNRSWTEPLDMNIWCGSICQFLAESKRGKEGRHTWVGKTMSTVFYHAKQEFNRNPLLRLGYENWDSQKY